VYQVSVPRPTPASSVSVPAEERPLPETAAGAAAVQSAIVSGLNAVAASAVAAELLEGQVAGTDVLEIIRCVLHAPTIAPR
jgi:hypothetical protein